MKILENYNLKFKNTFHINATVEKLFVPENEQELFETLKIIKNNSYYILSGGSNILLDDRKPYKNIISMEELDKEKKFEGNDVFYFGCSNRIQDVIKFLNDLNYGGFEELIGLPALFGGIIYMNAGIGSKDNQIFSISDFIIKVKVYNIKKNKVEYLDKDNCLFAYRKSIFMNNEYIILGAYIIADKQEKDISKKRIDDRINYCRNFQIWANGCFGTCFSVANSKILKLMSKLKIHKGAVVQASNNCNWLINIGEAKFSDAIYFINICKFLHKIFLKKIECEVRIWRIGDKTNEK